MLPILMRPCIKKELVMGVCVYLFAFLWNREKGKGAVDFWRVIQLARSSSTLSQPRHVLFRVYLSETKEIGGASVRTAQGSCCVFLESIARLDFSFVEMRRQHLSVDILVGIKAQYTFHHE